MEPNKPRKPDKRQQKAAQQQLLERRIKVMPLEKQFKMRIMRERAECLDKDDLVYLVLSLAATIEGY